MNIKINKIIITAKNIIEIIIEVFIWLFVYYFLVPIKILAKKLYFTTFLNSLFYSFSLAFLLFIFMYTVFSLGGNKSFLMINTLKDFLSLSLFNWSESFVNLINEVKLAIFDSNGLLTLLIIATFLFGLYLFSGNLKSFTISIIYIFFFFIAYNLIKSLGVSKALNIIFAFIISIFFYVISIYNITLQVDKLVKFLKTRLFIFKYLAKYYLYDINKTNKSILFYNLWKKYKDNYKPILDLINKK